MSVLYVDNLEPNLGSQVEIPDLKPLAGSLINCERKISTTDVTVTSSSYTDAISVTYTPASATSKIFIQSVVKFRAYRSGGADCRFKYRLLINGSVKTTHMYTGIYDYGGHGTWLQFKLPDILEFDSVSTAAITLKIQMAVQDASDVRINENGNESQFLFTEIAQ